MKRIQYRGMPPDVSGIAVADVLGYPLSMDTFNGKYRTPTPKQLRSALQRATPEQRAEFVGLLQAARDDFSDDPEEALEQYEYLWACYDNADND
jgi:hypothetical protein